jgi:hypothetical protein
VAGTQTVAVAFVVDVTGGVDPATFRVVETPNRARPESRYYSHIYAVATSNREDRSLPNRGAASDSVLAQDVVRHVSALQFHPALLDGRPTRSTVLVSCQATGRTS